MMTIPPTSTTTSTMASPMAGAGRIQLALNVTDLAAAVRAYSALFGTEPSKERPGYANFAIADPPLKLVLFENPDAVSPLNHLGVEFGTAVEVRAAAARFGEASLQHTQSTVDRCCHAVQDKVWVEVPDVPLGAWEFYTVLDENLDPSDTEASPCCAGSPDDQGACCGAGQGR